MKNLFLLFICLFTACLPKPASYPYREPALLVKEAETMSALLESYIYGWLAGKNPARIPDKLLLLGTDAGDNRNFYLQKYEEINPETQWAVRAAKPIHPDSVVSGVTDPHVTYLYLGAAYAPFGTKVVLEGEFPYCRFFSVQVSPPFDGKSYYHKIVIGTAEVSIADIDILPLPGNTNPFRVGAARGATQRKYRLEIDLRSGDALALNPDFKPPYQTPTGKLTGAFIVNQGPWYKKFQGKGYWNTGSVWIRYYAPDTDKGTMAGIPLPKVHYVLPTGEKYFINCDFTGFVKRANQPRKAAHTSPAEPKGEFMGQQAGWTKSYGILQNIGIGLFMALNQVNPKTMKYVRDADLGATGRGENQSPPNNYEPHATTNNYASYLGRGMNLGKNKVIVLTGKMPVFPDTRKGAALMPKGEVRYWSLGGYDFNALRKTAGSAIHSLMDDEVVLTKDRRFIIVYSRPEDRPKNARPENGVTWKDWGPTADLGLMLRWVSVSPDWTMPLNPHETNLPWKKASVAGTAYDKTLIGQNIDTGFMGKYLPVVHYLSRSEFENLGSALDADKIPVWQTY